MTRLFPHVRARLSSAVCAGAVGGALLLVASSVLSAQTYTFTTLAGQAGQRGAADGPAAAARFAALAGLAVDDAGNLYVADTGNHTIRRITSAGVVSTIAGTAGQSGAVDGIGPAARFNGPTAVAVDPLGNIYVADQGNALIRQITSFGLVITLPLASLEVPSSIALDAAGNGYVTDRALQIVGKTSPLGVQDILAGSPGRTGSADGPGGSARFNGPSGVTVDRTGLVFVLDANNGTVRRVGLDGMVTTLAGTALQRGYTDGPGSAARFDLRSTRGIVPDGNGGVLLADDGNHVIRRVSAAGVVATVAGLAGSRGSADGAASAARFDGPAALAIDRAGNLYVADTANHTIRVGRSSPANPYPAIAASPRSVTVNPGDTVALAVVGAGGAPATYQWFKAGVALAGATGAQLLIPGAAAADAGAYRVVIANAAGVVTSADGVVTLGRGQPGRVSNLSVRTLLAAGQTLTVGLSVAGTRDVLLRAVGPALGVFGVTGFHPDPAIALFNGAGAGIDGNDNWAGGLGPAFDRLGAFSLPAGSRDAALLRALSGSSTAQVSGPGAGLVLVEAYDAGGDGAARLVNASLRNQVGTGDNVLIAGFFVGGTAARTLLLRAIGPGLAGFGVAGSLVDPRIEVFDRDGGKIAEADDWAPALAPLFARVGAFALGAGSKDSALVITLPPGEGYTAQLSGVNGATGEALLEIYEVP